MTLPHGLPQGGHRCLGDDQPEPLAAVDRPTEPPHKSAHDEANDATGITGSTPTHAPRAGAMTALSAFVLRTAAP